MSSDVKRYVWSKTEMVEPSRLALDSGIDVFVDADDYNRTVAERDAAQAEVERLKCKLDEICDRLYQVKERWVDSIDDELKAECQLEANQSGCVVQVNIHGMCAARFKPNLVEHYKACIAEQSETCARYATTIENARSVARVQEQEIQQLAEAVEMLRRGLNVNAFEAELYDDAEAFVDNYDKGEKCQNKSTKQ